jgi:hypothetical protein
MKKYIITLFLTCLICSCGNDFLNVSPTTAAGDENLIKTVEDLKIATQGVYEIFTSGGYYQGEYSFIADLMGDHMMEPAWGSQHMKFFYAYGFNKVRAETSFFRTIYLGLQDINIILDKAAKLGDSQDKNALTAELRTLRALMHFDLVRMYGPLYCNLGKGAIKKDALGIRIAKEPIVDMRATFYRDKASDVYEFIRKELEEAVPDLPKVKRNGYIDYWGGKALLSKVYLYMEDNNAALAAAEEVIKQSGRKLYNRNDYVASWSVEYGNESLFELSTSVTDNSGYTSLGWICSEKGYKTIVPTKDFLELYEADPEDVRFQLLRKSNKDNCYYISGKYPGRDDNIKVNNPKVIRLSEVYLIAAEAALKSGSTGKAIQYLCDLREKRTATDPRKYESSISIDDILYERAVELYGEGNRAWDLWRNRKAVVRYTSMTEKEQKGHSDYLSNGVIEFDFYQTIYPIAERELELLPVEDRESQQNPGY